MNGFLHRCTVVTVAALVVLPQVCMPRPASARVPTRTLVGHMVLAASAHAPQRIAVPEPPRVRPSMFPAGAIRPTVVKAVRPLNGRHVPGPPMFQPRDIDGALNAAARRRSPATAIDAPAVGTGRRITAPGTRGTNPVVRQGQSLPSDPSASGTGINPWWRYQEQSVPGGGHVMVNVGTGNLLLQDDDMSVPHKGVAMAFRRTYNSQTPAAFAGEHVTWVSLFGNGWTNTFDAHIVKTAVDHISVFDIDGARYDYVTIHSTDRAGGYVTTTPGAHGILRWDGGCGFTWTKKSGTVYYFYDTNYSVACPALGTVGGYAGRLHQIIGRNRNINLTFSYSWDNGDASLATGKISAMTVQAESGLTAAMSFADVNGRRLLQQLTLPDSTTTVSYSYDAQGNLSTVTRPPNNSAGTRPVQSYTYQPIGSGYVVQSVGSPRWNAACASSGCGGDGGTLNLGFSGTDVHSSTVNFVGHWTTANPTIPDGTGSTGLQAGYPTTAFGDLNEFYTTGVTMPTYRDTNGHMTNWVVDGTGRPTQTQECTASTNQGQQCSGVWLVANQSWDANNNLTSETDPRGNETDFAYDPNGNAIAVGQPYTSTSQGSFKPTKLFDYDAFNNVVAYCDEGETHAAAADWTSGFASQSDSLCTSQAGVAPHWRATFSYPTYEPYGELASMTSPLGYTRTISYAPGQQTGVDFGLPTSVSGDSFAQIDGSTIAPTQTLWYDATGNLRCYRNGPGTSVLSYDSLGRMTSVADPDDSSANATSVCGKSTGQPGWNTQTTYAYNPDGSKQSSQSPSERSFGVSTAYTYDLDGNVIAEDRHHGCVANKPCVAGRTRKWYDGADRLIEVAQPHDSQPSSSDGDPWMIRYVYDISQGNAVSVTGSAGFRAFGNLFKTQNYVRDASATLTWQDVRGSAFDALDREVQQFSYTVPGHQLSTGSQEFDRTPSTLGLRWRKTNPSGEQATYSYDELGRVSNIAYTGDNGTTPGETFTFDPSGRQASATSALFGTEQRTYDADGRLLTVAEPAGGGLTDPATLRYSYYGNGTKSALSVSSRTFTQANAISYSYRSDGLLQTQSVNAFQSGTWTKAYTVGGRLQSIAGVDRQSRTYDPTGQLATYTLAGTTIAYPAHDPEGNVETVVFPNVPSGSPAYPQSLTETLTNVVNLRGELVDQSYSPNPNFTYPARHSTTNSGYRDTKAYSQDPSVMPPDSGTDIDYLNGIAVGSSSNGDSSAPDYQNNRTIFTFDAGGRQTRSSDITDIVSTFVDPNTGASRRNTRHVDNETVKTYDAENHTQSYHPSTTSSANGTPQSPFDPGISTIGWGPNGHPVQVLNDRGTGLAYTLHWDGDALLFVSDAAGNVVDFKVGTDGETAPSNTGGVTVYDRDTAGVVVMTSNATGNSGLQPLDSSDLSGPSYPATSGYQAPPRSYFDTNRADGYNFGTFRINGVRAFDAALGSWTTPDAYAGDVHDPASQQRYMWNRNNPYEYSDPSGFFPEEVLASGAVWGGADSAGAEDPANREEARRRRHRPGDGEPLDEGPHPQRGERGWVGNEVAGKILDWGRGQDSVEALHRKTAALTRAKTIQLRDEGLPEWKVKELYNKLAESWRAGGRKLDNDTLMPRMDYLRRILQLWPGQKI